MRRRFLSERRRSGLDRARPLRNPSNCAVRDGKRDHHPGQRVRPAWCSTPRTRLYPEPTPSRSRQGRRGRTTRHWHSEVTGRPTCGFSRRSPEAARCTSSWMSAATSSSRPPSDRIHSPCASIPPRSRPTSRASPPRFSVASVSTRPMRCTCLTTPNVLHLGSWRITCAPNGTATWRTSTSTATSTRPTSASTPTTASSARSRR